MKVKSLLALLMAISLMALTACGGGAASSSAAPAAESTAAESTAAESTASEAAGGEAAADTSDKTIAFCVATADDQWLSYMYDEAQNYAAEHEGEFKFLFGDGENDLAVQNSVVENWIMQGVDAVVVNPYDSESTGPIVDMLNEANIYAISVNRPFAKQENADCGVYGDSKQSGVMCMEQVVEALGGEGKVAILRGVDSQDAAIKRQEGFMEVVDANDGVEVVFEQTAEWNRDLGMSVTEDLLQSGVEFDAIACHNDEMAIGAMMALEAAGRDDVIIGGIDATPDALQYLTDDSMYKCTVFQDAKGQAYGAMDAAARLVRGEDVEAEILIDYQLVLPADRDKYLEMWGV